MQWRMLGARALWFVVGFADLGFQPLAPKPGYPFQVGIYWETLKDFENKQHNPLKTITRKGKAPSGLFERNSIFWLHFPFLELKGTVPQPLGGCQRRPRRSQCEALVQPAAGRVPRGPGRRGSVGLVGRVKRRGNGWVGVKCVVWLRRTRVSWGLKG